MVIVGREGTRLVRRRNALYVKWAYGNNKLDYVII